MATDIWSDPTTREIYFETVDSKIHNLTIYDVDAIIYIASEEPIIQTPIQLADGSPSLYVTTTGPSTIDIYNLRQNYRSNITYDRSNLTVASRTRVWLKLIN